MNVRIAHNRSAGITLGFGTLDGRNYAASISACRPSDTFVKSHGVATVTKRVEKALERDEGRWHTLVFELNSQTTTPEGMFEAMRRAILKAPKRRAVIGNGEALDSMRDSVVWNMEAAMLQGVDVKPSSIEVVID